MVLTLNQQECKRNKLFKKNVNLSRVRFTLAWRIKVWPNL